MKTIPFTCPHCGTYTEVAADYAGQNGPCAACRKPVTIPDLANIKKVRPSNAKKLTKALTFLVSSIGLLVVFLGIFGVIFVSALQPESIPFLGRTVPPPASCAANLERIHVAIEAYVKEKGHYPPAYTVDKNGKPMHSWRVLLLPYLGEQSLFSKYDMSVPWDDQANMRAVGSKMPEVFNCPDLDATRDETSYMVICGPTLVFDGPTERKPEEITDKLSDTLLVIEVADTDVHWMEPVDLSAASMTWTINTDKGIGSHHSTTGIHVLTADGRVRHVDDFTPPEELQGMATRGGGESIDTSPWEPEANAN